jgi:hypothetical protein
VDEVIRVAFLGESGLRFLCGQGLAARAVICTESRRAAIPGIIVMPCA